MIPELAQGQNLQQAPKQDLCQAIFGATLSRPHLETKSRFKCIISVAIFKVCSKCGELKDTSLFSKDPKGPGGFRSWCRKCTSNASNEIQKKRYAKDPTFSEVALAKYEETHPDHSTWSAMKQRCTNPKNAHYPDYGGRGITVCKEWQDSWAEWYDHVSKLPHFGEKGYTQDRINNDGNYEPDNIRWATKKEQRANQRTIRAKYPKETK